LRSKVRALIDKADGVEISRTHEQHPHGKTNRLTVVADLARVLLDSKVIVNTVSTLWNELLLMALGIHSIRLMDVETVNCMVHLG